MTVIALDAMGGDFAPRSTVEGAIRAADDGTEVLLVGDERTLTAELATHERVPAGVRVVHAPDAIAMDEQPSLDLRRRSSSILVGLELVKRGEAGALVSMGNTGALMALALVSLGKLPGVERPALAAMIPARSGGPTLVVDAGANAESRSTHLVQWAAMGAEYMRVVGGVAEPRVGLLSIGEEPSKGSPLVVETNRVLAASSLNFVGNVEGRDIVDGDIDVLVTDGFTGNVALKLVEGMVTTLLGGVRDAAKDSWRARLGGLLLMPALRTLRQKFDYRQYGGVPLIGVDGIVLVGHGRSDAVAVANAVHTAAEAAEHGALEALRSAIAPDAAGAADTANSSDEGPSLRTAP
mgnify:CR=1 FL=1